MRSSKASISMLLAVASIAAMGAGIAMPEPKPLRAGKPRVTPARWIRQTQEQAEWNAAVDARKMAKKARNAKLSGAEGVRS